MDPRLDFGLILLFVVVLSKSNAHAAKTGATLDWG